MRKISETRSIKGKIALIFFLVVGILFIIFGIGFYFYTLPFTQTLIPGEESTSLIVIGVIIIIGTVIGRRIVVFIPKENRGRVFKGSMILLIGAIILASFINFWLRFTAPFMEYYILHIDAMIIGIALILAGIFTIRPLESSNGKKILGIITVAFSVLIIIIPLFHISLCWNSGLGAILGAIGMSSPFWLISIIFFTVSNAYIRKEKSKSSDIDEQLKMLYHLSIGLLVCGWTLLIVIFTLFAFLWFFGFIGGLVGFIGLYGIIMYRSSPDKLRNYLLKRTESKEAHKVQV